MTVETLLRMLLDMDAQCLTGRPSACGLAAQLVHALAEHAEPSLRRGPGPDVFGAWESVDMRQVKFTPLQLAQSQRGKR